MGKRKVMEREESQCSDEKDDLDAAASHYAQQLNDLISKYSF